MDIEVYHGTSNANQYFKIMRQRFHATGSGGPWGNAFVNSVSRKSLRLKRTREEIANVMLIIVEQAVGIFYERSSAV